MTTPSQQIASEQFANHSRWPNTYREPTGNEWLQEVQQLKRDLAAAQEARQLAEALAESNARDAERYRWLKSETANPEMGHSRVHIALDAYTEEVGHKGDELDAAIDAAREKP